MKKWFAACVLFCVTTSCDQKSQQQLVDISRQITEQQGTVVEEPAASSIFPTNGTKWYTLEIGPGKAVTNAGKRTWLVELRGWLTGVSSTCNQDDPDWHYSLEPDPEWADQVGMALSQLLRAGNMVAMVSSEAIGDAKARRIVGVPNVNVELNGYAPGKNGGVAAPSKWGSFNTGCSDNTTHETVSWAFNPLQPLFWQQPLKAGDYVRMYGALVTDGPHTQQGYPAEFLCRQFNIGAACATDGTEGRLALIRWAGNRPDDDPTNAARWTEMHPPDIIAVLPAKEHKTNLRSVAVSAENCLIGPCEKTTLDVDLPAPAKPSNATTVAWKEEVIAATNYSTITDGHQNSSGQFDGATVTPTATGIHVHVAVQGQAGYGAHGRFGALYRISWQ